MADRLTFPSPTIRLELRNGAGRPAVTDVISGEFLIGTVPGCDLRLSGSNLPAVLCVISRQSDSVHIRKLAPTVPLLLNGHPFSAAELNSGDLLTLGPLTILVAISAVLREFGDADGAGTAQPAQVHFAPIDVAASPPKPPPSTTAELDDDLTTQKRELYRRYQERRDRLAGLQQAVDNAAKKLQERKRIFDAEAKRTADRHREAQHLLADVEAREQKLTSNQEQIARAKLALDEETQQFEELRRDLTQREAQYKSDVVRLDRLRGSLDEREKQLTTIGTDLDRRATELDEREQALSESTLRQREQADQVSLLQNDWTARNAALAERERMVEAQQAAMATMRSRLERTRDDVRREASLLVEQRARQEAAERTVQEQSRQIERLRAEFAADQQSSAAAQFNFDERSATIQAALTHLRQVEERLTVQAADLEARTQEVDGRVAEQNAIAEELQRLAAQLEADRNAISERDAALEQSDETRRLLQEQLQRRADELTAREKKLEEAARLQTEAATEIEELRQRIGQARAAIEEKWTGAEDELRQKESALDARTMAIDRREETLQRHIDKLRAVGAAVASERKANHVAQARWTVEQSALVAEADALRTELEMFRRRTAEESEHFRQQIPELELRGEAVLARLAQAREQLRAHVTELHDYTQECHRDLHSLRSQLTSDYERIRTTQLALQQEQSEHRLAVAAFRQQLVEWQGRIADMRKLLTRDGARLEWNQTEVDVAAQQLDAASQKLAREAADLPAQQYEGKERRTEIDRHLGDMREWYRKKLRKLAQAMPAVNPAPLGDEPAILAIAANTNPDDLDPADRQLGDLLRALELIEADMLSKLLNESRRQRRSLRQLLLSSRDGGMPLLTLYQLALIEAGNLEGLVLGPVRVVDRLMVNPRESIYRVFDPRRSNGALLRHLGEAEAGDAARAVEFRERFIAATAVRHDNVAATLEVLDIHGRPAVLQEWVTGLASTDWPSAAAAPGVWFRLMMQLTLGLEAAHRAGVCHGHLSPRTVMVTGVGVLKILGLGDPPWLAGVESEGSVAGDMIALGGLAASWAALAPRRRGNKPPKPLPAPLVAVMNKLRPDEPDGFTSASEVLVALEEAGAKLPDASDAWDELLEHASQSGAAPAVWRKSA